MDAGKTGKNNQWMAEDPAVSSWDGARRFRFKNCSSSKLNGMAFWERLRFSTPTAVLSQPPHHLFFHPLVVPFIGVELLASI
ncbi:hypothetical protein CEXT_70141 [Caerostris extrusa]|uniref:Uncharacterized protein n=1 Tax=Caerostris extrusa TaxID=172846 RepID=A0AAV4U6M2_CAEEX|nr:hypothetical protein CEXT_70141 [Caerostris extrusa]